MFTTTENFVSFIISFGFLNLLLALLNPSYRIFSIVIFVVFLIYKINRLKKKKERKKGGTDYSNFTCLPGELREKTFHFDMSPVALKSNYFISYEGF